MTRRLFLGGATAAGLLAAGAGVGAGRAANGDGAGPSPETPTLSSADRPPDRRYVVTGDRAYVVGTESGRFPATGWHVPGEVGGVWSPPIKLLDGIRFGVDGEAVEGEASETRATSRGLEVTVDAAPGEAHALVVRTDRTADD